MSRKDMILRMHHVLVRRRDALRKALTGDLSMLGEMSEHVSDDVVVPGAHQQDVSSKLVEVESQELVRIEYALERMREGRYGICEDCDDEIPMARLSALPYATHCIKCQRKMERSRRAV